MVFFWWSSSQQLKQGFLKSNILTQSDPEMYSCDTCWGTTAGKYWKLLFSIIKPQCFRKNRKLCKYSRNTAASSVAVSELSRRVAGSAHCCVAPEQAQCTVRMSEPRLPGNHTPQHGWTRPEMSGWLHLYFWINACSVATHSLKSWASGILFVCFGLSLVLHWT